MSAITAFINNEDLGRLKAELQILRRKGALKTSADYDSTCPDPDRSCGRCRVELGRVINRGAYCRACRLKVCKGCREYSFRTTDWVCTVCHKHMEIQAASGEWMNEFVRRPSRRRDNRVYVPAADIIKRTIRRSWTISNPTSRWNAVRGSPEIRPYNSLPRGQDIANYPSLAVHQTNAKNTTSRSPSPSKPPRKHSPAKRSHSEDVYNERETPKTLEPPKSPRINPLIKYASTDRKHQKQQQNDSESDNSNSDKENDLLKKNKRKLQHTKSEVVEGNNKQSKQCLEVSMSVDTGRDKVYEKRVSFSNDEEDGSKGKVEGDGAGSPDVPIELCDIEPISGTVFRKVTVRRRRQEMRKMPATDAGTRLDILLPEGDDYKLVFISSDSSSKEEDPDDNDSSSASSFPIDECDWDYFEPGGKVNFSDVVECVHQKEVVKERCERCGGSTQYVPVPVPVPIPVPVHSWSPVLGSMEVLRAQLRVLPRVLWPYLNQAAVMWAGEDDKMKDLGVVGGYLESESRCEESSSSDDEKSEKSGGKSRSYTVNISDEDEDKNKIFGELRANRSHAVSSEKGIRKSKSFSVNSEGNNHSDGVRKSRSYCEDGAWKHKTYTSDRNYLEMNKLRKRTHNNDGKNKHENEVEKMFNYFIEEVRKNTKAGKKANYFETDRIYTTSEGSNSNDGYDLTISDNSEKERGDYSDEGRKARNLSESDRSEDKNYDNESENANKYEEFNITGKQKHNKTKEFKSDFPTMKHKSYLSEHDEFMKSESKDFDYKNPTNIDFISIKPIEVDDQLKQHNVSNKINLNKIDAKEKITTEKSVKNKNIASKNSEAIPNKTKTDSFDLSSNAQYTKTCIGGDLKSEKLEISFGKLETKIREEDKNETGNLDKHNTKKITRDFVMKSLNKNKETKEQIGTKLFSHNENETIGNESIRDFVMNEEKRKINMDECESSIRKDEIPRDFVMKPPNNKINEKANKSKIKEESDEIKISADFEIKSFKEINKNNRGEFLMESIDEGRKTEKVGNYDSGDFVLKSFEEINKKYRDENPTETIDEGRKLEKLRNEEGGDVMLKSFGEINKNKIVMQSIDEESKSKKIGNDDSGDFILKSFEGINKKYRDENPIEAIDEQRKSEKLRNEESGDVMLKSFREINRNYSDENLTEGRKSEKIGNEDFMLKSFDEINKNNREKFLIEKKIEKTDGRDFVMKSFGEIKAISVGENTTESTSKNIEENNDFAMKQSCGDEIKSAPKQDTKRNDNGAIKDLIDTESEKIIKSEDLKEENAHLVENRDLMREENLIKENCDIEGVLNMEDFNDEKEHFDVIKVVGDFDEDDFQDGSVSCGSENMSISDDSDFQFERCRSYIVNASDDEDDAGKGESYAINDSDDGKRSFSDESSTSSDCSGSDDDGDEGVSEKKRRKYSRVYVVNSDGDEGDEEEGVVLKRMASLDEAVIVGDSKGEYMSSPGLSDVSAESLSSSDVELSCDKRAAVGEWNESASVGIRSVGAVTARGDGVGGEQAGVSAVVGEQETSVSRHAAARYTSLVMITQDSAPSYAPVSVVTSDTTTLVADGDVVVRHTNWNQNVADDNKSAPPRNSPVNGFYSLSDKQSEIEDVENVTVITGADTLSAVVCLEEGLADDDSWVETISHDDEDDFCASTNEDSSSGEEVTLHCTAAIDHEDELRGYHRSAIDFTLHTIVEESCEESEVETTSNKKTRPTSATDLEKYFYFGLGDGNSNNPREDQFSETSSICSESMDSFPGTDDVTNNESTDPAELASSRLEKYFLTGFTSFKERRDSDGSVGSDSEGRPSPEQRRKRLVRARGTGRSHSSSLDNLISNPEFSSNEQPENQNSEDSSSSDTDTYDDSNNFEKIDGQFDTVKRKKCKKQTKPSSPSEELKELNEDAQSEEDGHKTPQPVNIIPENIRDSGFIGSNDDLNKDPEPAKQETQKTNLYNIQEEKKEGVIVNSTPPATLLTRKDSFNNWSSDEETNLMMSKMRQFFKTMVNVNAPKNQNVQTPGKPTPSPRLKNRHKPPQLVYFENELTRLMKTVPGIRDDQVREIVEYLSSEDTWSDSYDSSDYTSSDLENSTVTKSALQQQISDSCKQIINKFDSNAAEDEEGDEGDGGIVDETHGLNRETAFVYQKLIASFDKMATGEEKSTPHNSPPLIAKVMHHIGSRLVALMHEVSSGESHASNSPKNRHYHKRLQQKLSNASTTTTEDDDSISECNLENLSFNNNNNNLLPRSRSHDLLLSEKTNFQTNTNDTNEEREVSDCERFSWRGSFESALLATDSRNKLSEATSSSALALAAKRRSAGDLLFTHKSLSREQLDRVRSCGSIGGANPEDKIWARPSRRRSSVPDASCGSGGSADDEDDLEQRSTLPRSLQTGTATTNSLPRLPTNTQTSNIQKAQSMYHFLQQGVKSARYRPPGFNRLMMSAPKRAVSAPGLQPTPQRRGGRRQQTVVPSDDVSLSEAHSSPMLASRTSKSASPSPVAHKSKRAFGGSQEWHSNEDDIDRLVSIHHTRSSLSNLGVQSHFTRVSRSDSMASVYSGAGEGRYGTVAVKGQVEFGLQYNYKTAALEINVKQCKDLAAVDAKRSRSDPYVKVYLLPDKSKSGKRKTKVKKHTLNPVFDECLKFHISLNGLETRTLWLTVWHSDMFGRNDFLGEVMMTLENKVFDDPTLKWYNLQERTEPFDDMLSFKGDILVGLKFVPPDMTVHKKGKRSRGALHVLVKEAKSLTAVKANGTSDPFCKSYLLPDKGRSGKQKTSVVRRTTNPVWNHTFIYDDVTLQELAERCLELTVWDHDRLASNEFLGGVRFSLGTGKHYGKPVDWMDATGKEMTLWKSMLERPNFWVEGCLSLRPTLDHRTTS